jgi:chromosome segregation ATPase
MRFFISLGRLAVVLLLTLGATVMARADDAASLRQELDSLRGKIEQLDTALTDTDKGSAALKQEADDYAAKVKASDAAGDELKQRSQQLTMQAKEFETERATTEQLCHKTSATTEEYQAALAQCDKARQAYQQHTDAYRAEQQRLATDAGTYAAAARELQASYKDIEQKRHDILAKQASLQATRQQTLDRFNAVRDRLNALHPNVSLPVAGATHPN